LKEKKVKLTQIKLSLSKYKNKVSPKELELKITKSNDRIKSLKEKLSAAVKNANGMDSAVLTKTVGR